jgi:glutamate/tyrosine decarboxylase-like PLP-dependent enzyme
MSPSLYAMFLGPKGENADLVERLVLEALRDTVFWRRNFHPEDERMIPERIKRENEYQAAIDVLQHEFAGLLAKLKRDVPFYSPRYIGHMLGDQLLPATLGYFAAMLHNPNNVSLEGSPETTALEMEAAGELARLMGYEACPWGHITAGGTIANIEALWVARNLRYHGLACRNAAHELRLETVPITSRDGRSTDLLSGSNDWILLNLDIEETLALRERLIAAYVAQSGQERPVAARAVEECLRRNTIAGLGIHGFFCRPEHSAMNPGVVIAPVTAHYSLAKAAEVLGLGREQILSIPVDARFRMDVESLRVRLQQCLDRQIPVIALVSVLGTTEEGSVDAVHEIAKMREDFGRQGFDFYHHCDAAWGGYLRTLLFDRNGNRIDSLGAVDWLGENVFHALQALDRTDSATIDPHKLGFIPYPCGAILFRNERVRDLISFDASYVFREQKESAKPFIGRYILEGSKPGAAAAACWLAQRVVPLNQGGHGQLVAATVQGAQALYLECRKLAGKLREHGILLHALTDPPDTNLFCFAVNRAGNVSLAEANRLNAAIFDELRFREEDVIQRHEFILSSTELSYSYYGMAASDGRHSLERHLEELGIPRDEFEKVGRLRILRCSITNPWLAEARGKATDYAAEFTAVLERKLERLIASSDG